MALLPAFLAFYIQHRLQRPASQQDKLQVGTLLQQYSIDKQNNARDDLADTLLAADRLEGREHRPRGSTNTYMRYLVGAQGSYSEQAVQVDNTTINYGMGVTVSQTGNIEVAVALENDQPIPGTPE